MSNQHVKLHIKIKYDKYVVKVLSYIIHLASMEAKEDMQAFLDQFGQRVKQLRKSRKLTQLDLAARTEIDVRQIQRIEYGEINTSIWNAHVLAEGLGVSISELFAFQIPD